MESWKVLVNNNVAKEVERMLKNKLISREESLVIGDWIRFVKKYGPYQLDKYTFFDFKDHALSRDEKWNGCRSSSFSHSGRIIYKIEDDKVLVEVIRITPDHNYK